MTHSLKTKNSGVYLFVIDGIAKVFNDVLQRRDGMAITGAENVKLEFMQNSKVLLMEVPH